MTSKRLLCTSAILSLTACFSAEDGGADDVAGTGTTGDDTTSSTGPTTDGTDTDTTDTADTTDTTDTETETTGEMAECGNGVVETGEACDDGVNDGSYGGCNPDCQSLGPHCGDGEQNGNESCDDGDMTNGNGCNNDCLESGQVQWTAMYNSAGANNDGGSGIATDGADNVIAVGSLLRTDLSQGYNVWVRKYTPDGADLWTQGYNSPDNHHDSALDVAVDDGGDAVVVGDTRRDDLGQYWNIFVARYASDGNQQWFVEHSSPGSAYDTANGVALDDAGNAYVAGYLGVPGDPGDLWLGKYTSDGGSLWTRTYNGSGNDDDEGTGVSYDGNGGAVVVGETYELNDGVSIWLRRYDAQGAPVWTTLQGSGGNIGNLDPTVAMDPAGNFIVAATLNGDVWLRKYSANGDELWTTTYDNPAGSDDGSTGVATDSQGNVLVSGFADRSDLGEGNNILVLKFAPDGSLMWMRTETSGTPNGNDVAADVATDGQDNVLVIGGVDRSDIGEGRNIWVRKYSP